MQAKEQGKDGSDAEEEGEKRKNSWHKWSMDRRFSLKQSLDQLEKA